MNPGLRPGPVVTNGRGGGGHSCATAPVTPVTGPVWFLLGQECGEREKLGSQTKRRPPVPQRRGYSLAQGGGQVAQARLDAGF